MGEAGWLLGKVVVATDSGGTQDGGRGWLEASEHTLVRMLQRGHWVAALGLGIGVQ